MGQERGGAKDKNDSKPKAKPTPMSNVAKTSGKYQEFVSESGKRTSGILGSYSAKTDSYYDSSSKGASPIDVQAVVGSTQSEKVKAGLSGVAGITSKNLGQLQQRVQIGQIPETVKIAGYDVGTGPVLAAANLMGKKLAGSIMTKIGSGGKAVFDTSGQIVGAVDKNFMGFDVYTGQTGFNPLRRKDVKRVGQGYMLSKDPSVEMGADGGGALKPLASSSSGTTTVSGGTSTNLSSAARRSAKAASAAGATRRQFLG